MTCLYCGFGTRTVFFPKVFVEYARRVKIDPPRYVKDLNIYKNEKVQESYGPIRYSRCDQCGAIWTSETRYLGDSSYEDHYTISEEHFLQVFENWKRIMAIPGAIVSCGVYCRKCKTFCKTEILASSIDLVQCRTEAYWDDLHGELTHGKKKVLFSQKQNGLPLKQGGRTGQLVSPSISPVTSPVKSSKTEPPDSLYHGPRGGNVTPAGQLTRLFSSTDDDGITPLGGTTGPIGGPGNANDIYD